MVVDHRPVKYVDQRELEKELVGTLDIAVLYIHLPQLIGGNGFPFGQPPRPGNLFLALGQENVQLFAEPLHLFVINGKPVFLLKSGRKLAVAIKGTRVPRDKLAQPLLHLLVRHQPSIPGPAGGGRLPSTPARVGLPG